MKQADLDRAVARLTGESIRTIKRLGFGLALDPDESLAPIPDEIVASVIDWDDPGSLDHARRKRRPRYEPAIG